jgi:plastocyanin
LKAKSLFAVTAAGLALALGLAACGDDDDDESAGTGTQEEQATPEPTGPAAETVELSETEYKITPADVDAKKSGVVEFDVTNDGSVTHALEVEGGDVEEETEDIAPGESATLKVDLAKGVYEIYCPIDDHKERGMTGELSVAGATGSPEGESSEDESSEDDSSEDDSSSDDSSSSGY